MAAAVQAEAFRPVKENHMGKHIKKAEEIFHEIVADYKKIFGDDIVGIILYGSAAGQDYRPGKSDINFMIILSENGIERLGEAFAAIRKWRKKNVATPLFLTEDYIRTSLDVFPIEYINFKENYRLVFGKDVLKDLTFSHEFLRLQCEREIKGKLLLLREAFLESAGKAKALKLIIGQSVEAFIAIFRGLLYLKGEEVLPRKKHEILEATAREFGLDGGVFQRLLNIKDGALKADDSQLVRLFGNYLHEVRKLSKLVDELGG